MSAPTTDPARLCWVPGQDSTAQKFCSPGLLLLPASPCCTSHRNPECLGHSHFPFIKETAFPSRRRFVPSSIAGMLYNCPSSCFILLQLPWKSLFSLWTLFTWKYSPEQILWAKKTSIWNLNGKNLKHLGEEKMGMP